MAILSRYIVTMCGDGAGSGSCSMSSTSSVSGCTATSTEFGIFMPSWMHLMMPIVPCTMQPAGRVWFL